VQRIDVNLGNAPCSREHREPHQQLLQRRGVDGPAAADAPKGAADRGPLDHPPREGRRQRRQPQRAVLEQLDQLAAHAEQQTGPNCESMDEPTISS
jgi:hypothetical protein